MYARTGIASEPLLSMTSATSRFASRGSPTTSGAIETNLTARTAMTTMHATLRRIGGRVGIRFRIEAAPVLRKTKIGTRRKLTYRGRTNACTIQRKDIVPTAPEARINRDCRSRASGLALITTTARAMNGSQNQPGTAAVPSIQISPGKSVKSSGAVASH
jgi:hypothetical protein